MDKKCLIIGIIIMSFIIGFTGCFEESNKGDTPIINSFTATPLVIDFGNYSVLKWSTSNAESVNINNGIGVVSINGEYTVQPIKTSTYILTAVNSYGDVTASVSIYVHINNESTNNDSIEEIPNIGFSKQATPPRLMVTMADAGLNWDEFTINGGIAPTGEVVAGDFVDLDETGGNNEITIIHTSTNSLIGFWTW